MKGFPVALIILLSLLWTKAEASTLAFAGDSEFPPCAPATDSSFDVNQSDNPETSYFLPKLDFCSRWNPEFTNNGNRCCGRLANGRIRTKKLRCDVHRRYKNYCDEITPEQEDYTRLVYEGRVGDILSLIEREIGLKGEQAYCSVNNGFLAWGRRLIASETNRIRIRSPQRCTEFGTDSMIAMLEWLGRQVNQEFADPDYRKLQLLVGDVSAPRGGCLSGRGGRRGHLSHTNGEDVDLGFLTPQKGRESPPHFHRQFDVKSNSWLVKQIFKNPYACVKVIFLDRKLVRKLDRALQSDAEWLTLRRFVRHMPHHRNHYHVRVGKGPGQPGCVSDAKPELETEEMSDEFDEINSIDAVLTGEGSEVE